MPKRGAISDKLYEPCIGGGVILSPPRWADFESWSQLRRENRQYLTPWEPRWNESDFTRPSYRRRLASYKELIASDSAYPFHIFRSDDEQLVGACNLTHIRRGAQQSANIGYWIGEHHIRQGFARAAVRAAVRFAFEALSLHRIEAAVQPDNMPSINMLLKTGFTHEGTARGFLKIDGQWRDHDIYARLSSD